MAGLGSSHKYLTRERICQKGQCEQRDQHVDHLGAAEVVYMIYNNYLQMTVANIITVNKNIKYETQLGLQPETGCLLVAVSGSPNN